MLEQLTFTTSGSVITMTIHVTNSGVVNTIVGIRNTSKTIPEKASLTPTFFVDAGSPAVAGQTIKTIRLCFQAEAHLPVSSITSITNTSLANTRSKLRT